MHPKSGPFGHQRANVTQSLEVAQANQLTQGSAAPTEGGSQDGLADSKGASHLCDSGSTLVPGGMWAEFQSISI